MLSYAMHHAKNVESILMPMPIPKPMSNCEDITTPTFQPLAERILPNSFPDLENSQMFENDSKDTCLEATYVSPAQLTRLAKEAADALEYLSHKRFVHRDVRAANCLIDQHRSLKLADFGKYHTNTEESLLQFWSKQFFKNSSDR